MRSTIHLVSRADYWPFAIAVRERAPRVVAARGEGRAARGRPPPTVRAALAGGNTMRRKEIEALVGKEAARMVGLWVDLVRAPPSGTWERRRADLYALAEDWVGPPPDIEPDAAVEHLVAPLPRRLRPRHRQGRRLVHRPPAPPSSTPCSSASISTRDGRPARPPGRPAPGPRHPGAAALHRHLGREPARPRAPHRLPPRGAPAEDLPHQGAAVVPDLHRRRRRRGHLEVRQGPHRADPVRPAQGRRPAAPSSQRPSGSPPFTARRRRARGTSPSRAPSPAPR